MATSNVEYYERQKELQDTLHQSEQERHQLDLQLKAYFQSDQRLAKLKAVKLQAYWKKICEQEKRSKERNEQILHNFERTDAHIASLSARTDKLKFLKQQYEQEIERKYPQWREMVRKNQEAEANKEKKAEHEETDSKPVKTTVSSSPTRKIVSGSLKTDIFNIRATSTSSTSNKPVSMTPVTSQPPTMGNQTSVDSSVTKAETRTVISSVQKNKMQSNSSVPEEPEAFEVKEATQIKSAVHVDTIGPMNPGDGDNDSDLGSDVELPLSDTNPSDRARRESEHSRADSVQHFSRASSLQSSRKASEFGDLKPELTLDGLLYILKYVQNDFNEAFTLQGFYRSSRPDSKQKMEIIRTANHGEDLKLIDSDLISMVALDEMTLVIRNLSEGCLLPDSLLETDTTKQTADSIKSMLSPDAQKLWTGLFDHFDQIIKFKVMEPKEIACIFVPCLVEDGSPNQDKALSLLVRLLTKMEGDATDDASSAASPQIAPTPRIAAVTTPTFTDDGKAVPPLKFGSLIDSQRTITDEDSSMMSLSKEKIPLNETDAYKNMLSGTIIDNKVANDDTDDDDEIEKQFNSAITPREKEPKKQEGSSASKQNIPTKKQTVDDDETSESLPSGAAAPSYVPTAMTGFRSTMTSTGSNQTPRKQVGIKISSDLDTDTEPDILAASKNRPASESDDFDFYG